MGNILFSQPRDLEELEERKTLVFIEGNISAGKSSLVQGLKDIGYPVWEEAVDRLTEEYTDEHGTNILDLFYKNMKEHAFELQITSLTTRWRIIKEALDYLHSSSSASNSSPRETSEETEMLRKDLTQNGIKKRIAFVERSILTDLYSFASNLYESGCITQLQWKIYTNLIRDHIRDAVPHFGDVNIVFVYVRTDPGVCFERKIGRGRPEESTVPLEYFELLHGKNDAWLIRSLPSPSREGGETEDTEEEYDDAPIIIIDGNKTKEEVLTDVIENVGLFHLQTPPCSGVELLSREVQRHPLFSKPV